MSENNRDMALMRKLDRLWDPDLDADPVCPDCGEQFVSGGIGTTTTLVGYSSPPGHNHDGNCTSRSYTCANGHQSTLSLRRRCNVHGCDWVGKESCFCHSGRKVERWPVFVDRSKILAPDA